MRETVLPFPGEVRGGRGGGASFIAVNRRLRKSTGALSALFNVRTHSLAHGRARTHAHTSQRRHSHAGATRVRAENSRREASMFTLRPLVHRRRTRRAHRVLDAARTSSSTRCILASSSRNRANAPRCVSQRGDFFEGVAPSSLLVAFAIFLACTHVAKRGSGSVESGARQIVRIKNRRCA